MNRSFHKLLAILVVVAPDLAHQPFFEDKEP